MNETQGEEKTTKQEALKGIIRKLHDGVPADDLKREFAKLIRHTSPEEIADMENALIQEGFPPTEIQRLCDVHAQVFEQSLKKAGKASKVPGHPIYSFIAENRESRKILKSLKKISRKLKKGKPKETDIQVFLSHFNRMKEIEKHFQRKENQLFPALEAKKFTGPTQVMWGKHDEIRELIKDAQDTADRAQWPEMSKKIAALSSKIKKLIFLEEKILYPTAAKKLDEREWAEIKKGESEIGYAWISPSSLWDAGLSRFVKSSRSPIEEEKKMETKKGNPVSLSQGRMSLEQIDLMLKHLPVDITFVDENDQVCYYSDTQDRIFPRSPAIIGRKVQNCHPPNSVHIVNNIVEQFKSKKKDVAEFWIQLEGKFIYIRYFPVYDSQGNYRGVIEVSQEISRIKGLEGQRRLLDW